MAMRSFLVSCLVLLAAPAAQAVQIDRDPTCAAGVCEVDGFDLFGIIPTTLEVDVVFTDMQHVELSEGATTTIEFGVGNLNGNAPLDYTITFDLSDMNGDLITTDALVVQGTAMAGFTDIISLPLTSLPAVIFHDFHLFVEVVCQQPGECSTWDLRVAGGAGDMGTFVSGPIRFNRAVGGVWVPEPGALSLWGAALASGLVLRGRPARRRAGRRA